MSSQAETSRLRTIAPAKINLTFEVLGKRSDGYHEVRTVLQTIALADDLVARPSTAFALMVAGVQAEMLSTSENLVARAESTVPPPLRTSPICFSLTKRVPSAAGLGGGSSDAAAALRLMQSVWSLPDDTVTAAAAKLGSDVSFFLRGGTQAAAGRGERMTPLPDVQPCRILLTTPPIILPNKTAHLYSRLTSDSFTDGGVTERLAERIRLGLPFRGADYVNAFDAIADDEFPGLAGVRRDFSAVVGARPMLAGAGPSLFIVVPPGTSDIELAAWRDALDRCGIQAMCTYTIGADEATAIA